MRKLSLVGLILGGCVLPSVELGELSSTAGGSAGQAGDAGSGQASAGVGANPTTTGGTGGDAGSDAGGEAPSGAGSFGTAGGGAGGAGGSAGGAGGSTGGGAGTGGSNAGSGGGGGTTPVYDGPITEFETKTPNNRPVAIVSGPDGNLWFTGDKMIVRMTTAGVQTEFPLPEVVGIRILTSITVGPDGNIWFTDGAQRRIGKITLQGAITEYIPQPEEGSPDSIVAGPDGNLWFSNFQDAIGKVTTAGKFTLYPLAQYTSPTGVVAGADGKLWFTERNHGKIGRLSSAGAFDPSFALQDDALMPSHITLGPDGNVWFTEEAGWVGKITPAGVPTEYPMPKGSTPYYITAGPDNAMWVSLINADQVARVSLTGTVEVFDPPTADTDPYGITTGPDGNIWFCEAKASKVARLKLK